jgi:hypothetical protein
MYAIEIKKERSQGTRRSLGVDGLVRRGDGDHRVLGVHAARGVTWLLVKQVKVEEEEED